MDPLLVHGAGLLPDVPGVYFDLLFQAAGLLLAVLVAAALAGEGRLERRRLPRAAVAAAAVVLVVAAGPLLWANAKSLANIRSANAGNTVEEGRARCLVDLRQPPEAIRFTTWLRARMPEHARYRVEGSIDLACLGFTLLPRLHADPPEHAEYVVFYGPEPEGFDGDLERFEPGLALGRVR